MKQKLYELKHARKQALDAAKAAVQGGRMEDYQSEMDKVERLNMQIESVEKLLTEQERFGQEPPAGRPHAWDGYASGQEKKGYEAAVKSFAAAARSGFRVAKDAGALMNEGTGSDGGYAVPQDIVTRIIQLREAKESLLGEVTVAPVRTKSGRRTFKKRSQLSGFATVEEAANFGLVSTPQFATLSYDVKKRGGVLPVTSELMADSDNNIAAVAEEWLADEARVTANREILAVVATKDAVDLGDLDGIKRAWVGLGSTFRATSKLITNDDGLLWLGTLKDKNGRELLTPNPAEPHQLQLAVGPYVLPVKTYDNSTLATENSRIPMILGDLKEGVVYWDRQQFAIKVSDVAAVGGLNAFEQDLILWRGSLRDDCTLRDDEAFVNGYISAAAAGDAGEDGGGGDSGGTPDGG